MTAVLGFLVMLTRWTPWSYPVISGLLHPAAPTHTPRRHYSNSGTVNSTSLSYHPSSMKIVFRRTVTSRLAYVSSTRCLLLTDWFSVTLYDSYRCYSHLLSHCHDNHYPSPGRLFYLIISDQSFRSPQNFEPSHEICWFAAEFRFYCINCPKYFSIRISIQQLEPAAHRESV